MKIKSSLFNIHKMFDHYIGNPNSNIENEHLLMKKGIIYTFVKYLIIYDFGHYILKVINTL